MRGAAESAADARGGVLMCFPNATVTSMSQVEHTGSRALRATAKARFVDRQKYLLDQAKIPEHAAQEKRISTLARTQTICYAQPTR